MGMHVLAEVPLRAFRKPGEGDSGNERDLLVFYIIDKLRERADADRAARRARQASAGGVGNGADIAAPSGRPAMAGDAAHSDLCLVRHNDEGDEG